MVLLAYWAGRASDTEKEGKNKMTKIDIISGFLGAGKTTFIKKLLEEAIAGEQVVLIENEFGEIGIDGGFLKDSGIEIREMNSGCICCSLVGDFGTSLAEVLTQYKPERIIIEPSGVGKLSDVMKAVIDVSADMDVELNSAVTIVDAAKCKMYMKNFGEFFNNQIENAGTIVLSRTDITDASKIQKDVDMIREKNANAVIITTPLDQLGGSQLLEIIEKKDTMLDDLLAEVRESRHHDGHGEECCGHHHGHDEECHEHHHDHDEECHEHHHDHDEECHEHHHHGHDEECHEHHHGHDEECHEHHHHDHEDHHDHGHHHHHEHGEYQDAHARAHANDIKRRFDGREVTNWQILLFGLTGGLIPCPAAITVLLICIQLKALTLGTTLVVSFSLGLALTLVTVGVGAAISVQQVAKRWSGFNTLAKRAPYFSSLLIGLVGVYMGVHGFMGIMR